MDNIEENPFAYILSKLAIARYEQTKEQLIELEDELRTVNRFFQIQSLQEKLIH